MSEKREQTTLEAWEELSAGLRCVRDAIILEGLRLANKLLRRVNRMLRSRRSGPDSRRSRIGRL